MTSGWQRQQRASLTFGTLVKHANACDTRVCIVCEYHTQSIATYTVIGRTQYEFHYTRLYGIMRDPCTLYNFESLCSSLPRLAEWDIVIAQSLHRQRAGNALTLCRIRSHWWDTFFKTVFDYLSWCFDSLRRILMRARCDVKIILRNKCYQLQTCVIDKQNVKNSAFLI